MDSKRVYTVEILTLLDDTAVTVKPFSIKKNRLAKEKINKIITPRAELDEAGDPVLDEDGNEVPYEMPEEEAETLFMDVVAMSIGDQAPHLADRETLEDVVDEKTMFEIIKVATGFDFLAMQARVQRLMENQITEGRV